MVLQCSEENNNNNKNRDEKSVYHLTDRMNFFPAPYGKRTSNKISMIKGEGRGFNTIGASV
jgi:hypothetical protein